MSEIDGADYRLEQIRQGVEGADYTKTVADDGSEILDIGDGIKVVTEPNGRSSIRFSRP